MPPTVLPLSSPPRIPMRQAQKQDPRVLLTPRLLMPRLLMPRLLMRRLLMRRLLTPRLLTPRLLMPRLLMPRLLMCLLLAPKLLMCRLLAPRLLMCLLLVCLVGGPCHSPPEKAPPRFAPLESSERGTMAHVQVSDGLGFGGRPPDGGEPPR